MIRCLFLLTGLLCGIVFNTIAQVQASVYLGSGYAYASVNKGKVSNNFAFSPHAAFLLHLPVGKKGIGIETGIAYTVKGFTNADTLWEDDGRGYWAYRIRSRLGYLSFPLVLTYRYTPNRNHAFIAGAGMVYGFMIKGETQGRFHIYRGPDLQQTSEFTLPVAATLMPSDDGSGAQTYLFDAGLKLQLSYVWHGRLGIRLFHEHSLYTYHTPGSTKTETKLRYIGMAFSFGFPRL